VIPIALGIAPFVSKRNTPLDGLPFAGIDVVEGRLDRLRKGLAKGRADVRPTSARWAWVEWVLAQGGAAAGAPCYDAMAGRRSLRGLQEGLRGGGGGARVEGAQQAAHGAQRAGLRGLHDHGPVLAPRASVSLGVAQW
jgi:hypothetical protein